MVLGLREQDVNVIAHGIDLDQRRLVVFENASDVGVELAAFLVAQELATAFRGEHKMNDDVGERLGHGVFWLAGLYRAVLVGQSGVKVCRPYRARDFVGVIPGPSARAITWQAFGPLGLAGEPPVIFCSPRRTSPRCFHPSGCVIGTFTSSGCKSAM